ncbi:MAG: hypothetical protein B6D63_07095 [Candidatus Latescibacteria bacterium 4484_7]|nr:MAG: hypothetical protein B6D63_07095 [Candidatus Latescibacteria bacterium 4484_7]
MREELRKKLAIPGKRLKELNDFLLDPDNEAINAVLDIVEKYGGPKEINRKAKQARRLSSLMKRLKESGSPYYKDVMWLKRQAKNGAFVSLEEYKKAVAPGVTSFNEKNAVTLEISALQYFPFLIAEAKQAIEKRELMPGRFIRVRSMKEQVEDNADILAVAASMQIVGASYVETLDTKGTDGSNIHLGGPETITGYFGGVGEPNEHALQWADEFLHYYTEYGIKQVLNVNPGTILIGYLLHKLGIENEFKISVYLGNDNPYAVMWTLMTARLLSDRKGSTSLIGFNFSNSVNNETIRISSEIRKAFGLEENVRFEHHIVETWKSIVIQPYDRRAELVEIAKIVPNISAKHEGGDIEVEKTREHPTDILDYFMPKEEVLKQGLMDAFMRNFLDKHDAVNHTARDLLKAGIDVIAAQNLH